MALPSAMLALVAIAVLLAGIFAFADLSAKSVRNREQATRATHVAEAGVNHAVALLRGSLRNRSFTRILQGADGSTAVGFQADDTVFINWPGLSAGDQIPYPAGQAYQGHTYIVTVADDPADTDLNPKADMNGRVRIWCRGITADGATAEVEAIVGAVPMPGIAADGNLSFAGAGVEVAGACGGVHANGNLSSTGGGPLVATTASATGTVTGAFGPAAKLPGIDEIVIPDLNPMNYCGGANFTLTAVGGAPWIQIGAGIPAPGLPPGWVYTAGTNTWSVNGTPLLPQTGTYCIQGNVMVAGSTGSAAVPKAMSILASGSIRVEGQPYLTSTHPDGIQLMAGGDIYLAGNVSAGTTSYQGMIYAGAQCSTQGNATANGQLLCANGAQPAGATEWTATNAVTGSFKVNFDCSGNIFNKRRVLFWYPRVGT